MSYCCAQVISTLHVCHGIIVNSRYYKDNATENNFSVDVWTVCTEDWIKKMPTLERKMLEIFLYRHEHKNTRQKGPQQQKQQVKS